MTISHFELYKICVIGFSIRNEEKNQGVKSTRIINSTLHTYENTLCVKTGIFIINGARFIKIKQHICLLK